MQLTLVPLPRRWRGRRNNLVALDGGLVSHAFTVLQHRGLLLATYDCKACEQGAPSHPKPSCRSQQVVSQVALKTHDARGRLTGVTTHTGVCCSLH